MNKFYALVASLFFSCAMANAQEACDVNKDGSVDISDVNKVISRICGGAADTDSAEYVNLELPSGTLWAKCNVGATTPEEYGDYFAWGETSGYFTEVADGHTFEWGNYKLMTKGFHSWTMINKYTIADGQTDGIWYENGTFVGDGKMSLESTDDAAAVNLGGQWRIPTRAQMKELILQTKNENVTINGVFGRKFTSKKDPTKYIFLPAAGYCSYGDLRSAGSYGFYWMNELYTGYSDMACMYYFYSGRHSADYGDNRCTGQSIRPVRTFSAKK